MPHHHSRWRRRQKHEAPVNPERKSWKPRARQVESQGMERQKFEELVEQVLATLPEVFRQRLTNVAVFVEDYPPHEADGNTLLLGLFHGVPRTEKSVFFTTPPDEIFLYQRNIEAVCSTDEQIRKEIRRTLLHELGHYFGLNENELRGV